MLSLITTCKNRLPHLKQTLPLMLRQPLVEVIVVDYGCEQGTAAWVKEHHPAAKVIEVKDDPVFCLARARNLGAKEASHDLLCFIDADVLLHVELSKWLELNYDPNAFYSYPENTAYELDGFVIVTRGHFFNIDGYDEGFMSWGGEDQDLYERLTDLGLSRATIPLESIVAILHGDDLRQLDKDSSGLGTTRETMSINRLYRAIKRDSLRLTGREIELEKRKELFKFIQMLRKDAHKKGKDAFEISINVPLNSEHNKFLGSHRSLNYKIPLRRPTGTAKGTTDGELP